MQTQLHGCLRDLSRELHARGGATLLAGLMSKVTRPLMALTLRVAPPDPIDSALFRAPPEPLWPKYVSLWVHLLGGDGFAVPGAPDAGENVSTKRNKRGSVSEAVTAAAAAARRRSRSLTLEASGSDRSGLDAPAPESASDPTLSGASDGGVRRLRGQGSPAVPHPATRRGSRAAAHGGGGGGVGAQSIGNLGGGGPRRASRWLGRLRGDERRARARARPGVAAADPGDMQTFLCLVDLACAVISAALRRARRAMAFDPDCAPCALRRSACPSSRVLQNVGAVVAAERPMPSTTFHSTCRAFLRDVLAGVERQTDASAPRRFNFSWRLPPASCRLRCTALAQTRSPSVCIDSAAEAALARHSVCRSPTALGRSSRSGRLGVLGARPHRRRRSRNGDRRFATSTRELDAQRSARGSLMMRRGRRGVRAYRAARVAARRAHAAELEAEDGAVGRESVETRVTRLLGAAGGAAHAMVDEGSFRV